MTWITNPTDPIHTWNGYDICIHVVANDGMDNNAIILLYRATGAANQWQSMGASDGTVWADDWSTNVAAKGGFKPWRAALTAAINLRITTWAAALKPVAPIGDPASFAEFQAWLKPNTRWTDSADKTTVALT